MNKRTIHEQLYLGVDGGASNITIALMNSKKQIVYEHTSSGGANYHTLGMDMALANIETAIQDAIEKLEIPPPVVFDYSVFGLSGSNFSSDASKLEQSIKYSPLSTMLGGGFKVVNDSLIALHAGLPEAVGIILLVGTGSNCLGQTQSGQTVQSGGMDYILSDEGSGYDIGLRALRAVTRQLDGRSEATRITKELLTRLQVDTLEQLYDVVYRLYTTKAAIASLADLVGQAAESGDHIAQSILNHSVNELLKMVDAVMTKLEWRDGPVSVVLMGSTILQGAYMRRRFEAEVRRINPQIRTVVPQISPAAAAALMAFQQANSEE